VNAVRLQWAIAGLIDWPPRFRHVHRVDHRKIAILGSSIVLGTSIAIMWMGAPIIPAIIGAAVMGAYLFWRATKG
jgi:hypothetical protein